MANYPNPPSDQERKRPLPPRDGYITAYQIAVKHGEATKEDGSLMTESEWIAQYSEACESANTAADTANTAAERAETAAESLPQYVEAAQAAQASAESARDDAEAAQASAETAKTGAETAEAATKAAAASIEEAAQTATSASKAATESATAAAESAASAAKSSQSAASSSSAAATSATGAETAKTKAETAAANAASSETNAATSETNAKASATAAAASEAAAEAAQVKAATSEGAADAAKINAQSAAATATSAKDAAVTAQSKAEAAKTAAESAETNAAASSSSAAESATAAAKSAEEAAKGEAYSKTAQSWAVGGTGTRTGEDTNNAKYWSDQAQSAAGGGVSSFNGRNGAVTPQSGDYTAEMVGALSKDTVIPTANDGALTISVNGTQKAKFTANSASNVTADITVPTKTSDLTNDSKYITEDDIPEVPVQSVNGKTGAVSLDATDVGADASGAASAVQSNLDTHAGNTTLHVTAAEKSAWNGKEAAGAAAAVQANLDAHTGDTTVHVTASERTTWDGAATAASEAKTAADEAKSAADEAMELVQATGMPTIQCNVTTGSVVTCTNGTRTVTGTSVDGVCTLRIPEYGTYTISATLGGEASKVYTVTVDTTKLYTLTVKYVSIYGVEWDGTAATTWSRTDDSALFANPTPYLSGAASYGSPFDELEPWSGMVRVTDSEAGELVAIPKFWYKWTKSGTVMKLQIADRAADGFYVSPAHMDRGDGKGERDIVYVGRYHCGATAYKSASGQNPKVNITRSTARTNIAKLGDTIWQSDFAMRVTIWMLYLVEFADWNSQNVIGYGCGDNSAITSMGYTDSMPYHTGTTKTARTTYGYGTQYRYIEGLWDNVYDWGDGCYYNSSGLNIILNPSSFSDSSGGTAVGVPVGGYPSAFAVPTISGLEWAIYPTATGGSTSTYTADYWSFNSFYPCLYFGGNYYQSLDRGLFYVDCDSASYASGSIGCRLQKLP